MTRVVYPDTATRLEQPLLSVIYKLDPEFAKEHRFDVAYEFGLRIFKVDSLTSGAYMPINLTTEAGQPIAQLGIDIDTAVLLFGQQDGSSYVTGDERARTLALIDAGFRIQNGFCDPADDGTVTTGTGAGGANPGTVPSIAAIKTEGGILFRTEDGRTFLSQDPAPDIGVAFDGG